MSNDLHLFEDLTIQESLPSKKNLNLAQFYFKLEFITQDEEKLARKHWPFLFR